MYRLKPMSKSPSLKEANINSEKEEDSIDSEWTATKDSSRSSSSDYSPDAGGILTRAGSVHSEQLHSHSSPTKPKREDYHSVDTLSELQPMFVKGALRIKGVKPFGDKAGLFPDAKVRNLEKPKDSIMISEWGDCYEDEDFRLSAASNLQRPYEDNWTDFTLTHNSVFTRLESSVVVPGTLPKMKNLISPGMVWAMLRSNAGPTFQLVKLSSSLQEVVDTFLKGETGLSLPVSFAFLNNTLPTLLSGEKMGMTLLENLEGHLDEKTQGLSFFVGSVNTKLCYKMIISDLEQFQKFFCMQRKC